MSEKVQKFQWSTTWDQWSIIKHWEGQAIPWCSKINRLRRLYGIEKKAAKSSCWYQKVCITRPIFTLISWTSDINTQICRASNPASHTRLFKNFQAENARQSMLGSQAFQQAVKNLFATDNCKKVLAQKCNKNYSQRLSGLKKKRANQVLITDTEERNVALDGLILKERLQNKGEEMKFCVFYRKKIHGNKLTEQKFFCATKQLYRNKVWLQDRFVRDS